MKKILVAYDASKLSEKAALRAFELARKCGSQVVLLSVIPELYLADLLEADRSRILAMLTKDAKKALERISGKAGAVKIRTLIRQGSPASEILDAALKLKADLIVTGSHGRHGAVKFLLGSVSAKVVDHAACSVLVVK